jgi:hypothetical protein
VASADIEIAIAAHHQQRQYPSVACAGPYASAHTDAGRIASILKSVRRREAAAQGEVEMLETIAVVLVILWLLGVVTSYTLGGVIHILLVIAIVVILVRVIQGRRL